MFRSVLPALAVILPAVVAACGDSTLYPWAPPEVKVPCTNMMLGYAAVGDVATGQATTGGAGSEPEVVVSDVARLTEELQSLQPRIIKLDGMLTLTAPIKITLDKDMRGGNKTLIGVGENSGLTGAGLDLGYADNVILQNLKISKAAIGEGDAITLLNTHHIWIDHCDLSSDRNDTTSGYDGLVDITHGSSYITVSWTRFHDHKDTTLVGHTADMTQMVEDAALSVTYHHNLFSNVNSGPRIRWGTGDVANNLFQNVTAFGVVSESTALVWVTKNVFGEDVPLPIATTYQDPTSGTMVENLDKFPRNFAPDIMRPSSAPPPLPYSLGADTTDSVPALVSACAGTGKITF